LERVDEAVPNEAFEFKLAVDAPTELESEDILVSVL
jgi:hypothetical protein